MNKKIKQQLIFPDGYVLDYILDIGSRKNIYLSIHEGIVSLKVPVHIPIQQAKEFLLSKEEWIKKNIKKTDYGIKRFSEYEDGEQALLLGKTYTLKLIYSDKYFEPYFSGQHIIAAVNKNTDKERTAMAIEKLIDSFAGQQIEDSFKSLCNITGLYPAKVTVKPMKSSWGRCSACGNISINRDIIHHSRECLEYVIIHELCHLKHMNHSSEFWKLVEKYCPDRKRIRKELNGR